MKVILVNTGLFRGTGANNHVLDLGDLLRQSGHEVAMFGMRDHRNEPFPDADLFVSPIDFRQLNQRKSPRAAARVLHRAIYSQEARRGFERLLDRIKPDIVHLHGIHAHITPSVILAARQVGVPVVWTLHDFKMLCPNTHLLNDRTGAVCEECRGGRYHRALVNRCKKGSLLASGLAAVEAVVHRIIGVRDRVNLFLCPSHYLHDQLVAEGFAAARVRHLPNFIPDEWFTTESNDGEFFIHSGRLEPHKGIGTLLAAARLAPEVPITVVGSHDGAPVSAWLEQAPSNVRVLAPRHGEALRSLVARCRAVVQPSLCHENQPLSVLEGFAMGKPAVVSDLGALPEIVNRGERGLVVPRDDPAELAAALQRLTANPDDITLSGPIWPVKLNRCWSWRSPGITLDGRQHRKATCWLHHEGSQRRDRMRAGRRCQSSTCLLDQVAWLRDLPLMMKGP